MARRAAEGYAAIPDASTEAAWSQALDDLNRSAVDCVRSTTDIAQNGVDQADLATVTASEHETAEAMAPMKIALTRLQNPTW